MLEIIGKWLIVAAVMISENILFAIESQMYEIVCLKILLLLHQLTLSKNSLDKFWSTQELKYNWQVEIIGTGSRSEVP